MGAQPLRSARTLFVGRLLALLLTVGFVTVTSVPVETAASQSSKKKKSTKKASSKGTSSKRYSAKSSRARRLKLARARAAARVRAEAALREAATPQFRTADDGELVPDVRAAAAIIYDPVTGKVLWEENSQDKRSIASITKVMTAVVFLEDEPDLTREIVVDRSDVRNASVTYLMAGERVRAEDLLHLLLIASDNGAARVLARSSAQGYDAFIDRMIEKAIELGLDSTSFADPSGLNPANMSSAYDMARLISYASSDERIAPVMRKPSHTLTTSRRKITIRSTNKLLGQYDIQGGKTGFIGKSGYCLATLLKLPQGDQIAVVVLGARSNAGRFWETRHLFNWLTNKAQTLLAKPAAAAGTQEE
jgi:D-alanyl-D-alanine endopeptidase (penicillin-binding protein 7)